MSAEPSDKNYHKNGVWIPFGPAGDSGLSVSDMVFFAYLFDQYGKAWLEDLGNGYRWLSRTEIARDTNGTLSTVPDTIYRAYKRLERKGLIRYKKFGPKDGYKLTSKAKFWGQTKRTKPMSEDVPDDTSEDVPNPAGIPSESGSASTEDVPTDHSTNSFNHDTKDKKAISLSADEKEKLKSLSNSRLINEAPVEARALFSRLKEIYMIYGEVGHVERCECEFVRKVYLANRVAEYATATQNMLNLRVQKGTAIPKLVNQIEREEWIGADSPLRAGSIRIPYASSLCSPTPNYETKTQSDLRNNDHGRPSNSTEEVLRQHARLVGVDEDKYVQDNLPGGVQ